MKVAVVVDSTSYLPKEILEKHNIYTIPLNVYIGGKTYREDEIDHAWYYEEMSKHEELPTTSQPSIGDYIILLETLYREGYTDVLSFHLSAEISGTCHSAEAAAASVDGVKLHVIDSEVAAAPLGFITLYAAQQLKSKSLDEVIKDVTEMKRKENTNAYFLVDKLENLQKGGRLSNAQAAIGGLLKIKPVLEFQDGKIVAIEKIRTQRKALNKIEERLNAEFDRHDKSKITACLIHANVKDAAEKYLVELQEKFPEIKFVLQDFGPVIGTHLGEGAIGLGYTTFEVNTDGL